MSYTLVIGDLTTGFKLFGTFKSLEEAGTFCLNFTNEQVPVEIVPIESKERCEEYYDSFSKDIEYARPLGM